jgi:hypothetical protein
MKKTIVLLIGALALLAGTAGCDWDEHEHHEHHGGAYDGSYHGYGHGEYNGAPVAGGYYDEHGYWHHH